MLAVGGGAIVNNSSVAGLVGFAGIPVYVVSKHGIVGLTKTAAIEYAPQGLRVNQVCPGVIDTEMVARFTHGERDGPCRPHRPRPPPPASGHPARSPKRSCGCARTAPSSSPGKPWASTAGSSRTEGCSHAAARVFVSLVFGASTSASMPRALAIVALIAWGLALRRASRACAGVLDGRILDRRKRDRGPVPGGFACARIEPLARRHSPRRSRAGHHLAVARWHRNDRDEPEVRRTNSRSRSLDRLRVSRSGLFASWSLRLRTG